jgi:aminoglycoside 6'-N-acetyltransferase I
MLIRSASLQDFERWQILRQKLWPQVEVEDSRKDFFDHLNGSIKIFILLAEDVDNNEITGFLEASIRCEYVEGCETDRVGYIEGWFVDEKYRRQNVGRKLVMAAENWARGMGCKEMASDCELENETSQIAHQKIGYEAISRNVHFKKWL